MTKTIEIFSSGDTRCVDFSAAQFPSRLQPLGGSLQALCEDATHYGYVHSGTLNLNFQGRTFAVGAGMYFCVPGSATVTWESNSHSPGSGFVASRLEFNGLFQVGGPIETIGRLRYIDGCSDTLLISPPVLGDPCLNLLCIPPQTRQRSHTHPSERLGMIASGHGVCKTPAGDLPLAPGDRFSIPADGRHSFHTQAEALRVIAFHPDSDFGPTHQNHPMINKTIIEGRSAAGLTS
ncbi:MAG: cupin domain-containing protein [Planctomycetota bacterium]